MAQRWERQFKVKIEKRSFSRAHLELWKGCGEAAF